MNNRYRFLTLALICLTVTVMVVPNPAAAQANLMSVDEFRENFTEYMLWLDSNVSPSQNLAMKVQAMSDEEFQALYDSFADPDAFIAVTKWIMTPPGQAKLMY